MKDVNGAVGVNAAALLNSQVFFTLLHTLSSRFVHATRNETQTIQQESSFKE